MSVDRVTVTPWGCARFGLGGGGVGGQVRVLERDVPDLLRLIVNKMEIIERHAYLQAHTRARTCTWYARMHECSRADTYRQHCEEHAPFLAPTLPVPPSLTHPRTRPDSLPTLPPFNLSPSLLSALPHSETHFRARKQEQQHEELRGSFLRLRAAVADLTYSARPA
jgi:hypothetical protein